MIDVERAAGQSVRVSWRSKLAETSGVFTPRDIHTTSTVVVCAPPTQDLRGMDSDANPWPWLVMDALDTLNSLYPGDYVRDHARFPPLLTGRTKPKEPHDSESVVENEPGPVSYTHLTLPTICSV